jgi:hypothetical protein
MSFLWLNTCDGRLQDICVIITDAAALHVFQSLIALNTGNNKVKMNDWRIRPAALLIEIEMNSFF